MSLSEKQISGADETTVLIALFCTLFTVFVDADTCVLGLAEPSLAGRNSESGTTCLLGWPSQAAVSDSSSAPSGDLSDPSVC